MIDQKNTRNLSRKISNRNRRARTGVGAIIGGVILTAILLTSVLVYFTTIANNEKVRTGYEFNALSEVHDKQAENYFVSRDSTISNGNLGIQVVNNGTIPMVASKMLVYCTDGPACINPKVPSDTQLGITGITLNAGESSPKLTTPVSDKNTYRIDIISERGNIVSSKACTLNVDTCEEDNGSSGGNGGNKNVVVEPPQGTGSLQLDFKSFGAIFPQYQSRNGIDQTGWDAKSANATGYPAFSVPAGPQVYLVERVRNLDQQGYSVQLSRSSGLVMNLGKSQGNNVNPVYLCGANSKTVSAYNELSSPIVLNAVPITSDQYTGWQELVFCSNSQSATNTWTMNGAFNNINGIFLVARGTYTGTGSTYAQTVPYQSLFVANQGSQNLGSNNNPTAPFMIACLRNSNVNTPCNSPTVSDTSSTLKYQASLTSEINPGSGLTLYLHVNAGPATSGYNVSWIHPGTGKAESLASNVSLNANTRNIPIVIDSAHATSVGFYTIAVTDGYDGSSNQDVYYMTFKVTP